MTEDVFVTTEDAKLADVARTMAEREYGCAVVVKAGDIVGIFTVADALRHLAGVSAAAAPARHAAAVIIP